MGYFCDRTVNELVIMRERSKNNSTKSRFDRKHLLVYGTVVKKMPRHSATAMRVGGGGGGGLIATSEAKEGLGAVWCDIKMHFCRQEKERNFSS